MSDKKIFEEIKRIITTEIGIEEGEISPDSHLENDLGIDSIAFIHITIDLEESFKIKVEDLEWEEIFPRTVGAMESFIKSKLN